MRPYLVPPTLHHQFLGRCFRGQTQGSDPLHPGLHFEPRNLMLSLMDLRGFTRRNQGCIWFSVLAHEL